MVFDESNVFSAVNADKVKVGSKGYFADDIQCLKQLVGANSSIRVLEKIEEEDAVCRFMADNGHTFNLFYLVEMPNEVKYRPYKNTDELVEDWKERVIAYDSALFSKNPMFCPLIWVKNKATNDKYLLVIYFHDSVMCGAAPYDLPTLFDGYTYLDGSPCGKKIQH